MPIKKFLIRKEELESKLTQYKTITAVSKNLGWTYSTTIRALDYYKIDRPVKKSKKIKRFLDKSKEELIQLLNIHGSITKISKIEDISMTTVRKVYSMKNIKTPNIKESVKNYNDKHSLRAILTKEKMERLLKEHENVNRVAKYIGVHPSTIRNICKYYGLK